MELFSKTYNEDLVGTFPAGEALWSIVLGHDAWPSIESDIIGGLTAFLTEAKAEDANMAGDLTELRRAERVSLVLTNTRENNPENMPLRNYAPVLYVAGDLTRLKEVLALVHAFLVHRITHPRPNVDRSPWSSLERITVEVLGARGAVLRKHPVHASRSGL